MPVIIENNDKQLKINALLDDGSTTKYINADIAAELGLRAKTQKVNINVLSGRSETFETMPVQVGLRSLFGKVNMTIEANTINYVTGKLQVVNWDKHANKFEHLRGIEFPEIGSKQTVDMLIGLDYMELHSAVLEIKGRPGEP